MNTGKDNSQAMRHIDENLRRVYREVEEEQVPDRFKELLEKLKEQDGKS